MERISKSGGIQDTLLSRAYHLKRNSCINPLKPNKHNIVGNTFYQANLHLSLGKLCLANHKLNCCRSEG